MADEQRGGRVQEIGAEHSQFAVGYVHDPAHAIDEDVAAGEQRVDRREYGDVDDELQRLTLSRSFRAGQCRQVYAACASLAACAREPGIHKLSLDRAWR